MRATAVRVRAPASSANLGPGYDVLAAALSLWLELEVSEADALSVESDVAGVPLDRSNLCVRAFEALAPADGLSFRIRSEIPVGAGLGSSAAATVAGLAAARRLRAAGGDVYEHAIGLEGHPDNAAAALHGGFVVCAGSEPPARLDPPSTLVAVLAIPPDTVPTSQARSLIPAEVPIADAVHNVARSSLLVLGVERGDHDLIARGLADRIHQPRRAALYPGSMELLGRARELGAIGATISGAGASVLLWCDQAGAGSVADRARQAVPGWEVAAADFAAEGVAVSASE